MQQSLEIQELDINLRAQHLQTRSVAAKRLYLVGAFILPVLSLAILLYDFQWTTLFYFVLFCANAPIYYGMAKNKDPYKYVLGKSYIKVNSQVMASKKTFQKPVTVHWNAVRQLQIKLFSVEATLQTGRKAVFNLEGLSDENLKLMKEQLHVIKDINRL